LYERRCRSTETANDAYRATCRARSHTEFTARIGIVAEESDESQGWLELIEAGEPLESETLTRLIGEATELTAITSAAYGTACETQRRKKKRSS
jgi:four helix bundle protein